MMLYSGLNDQRGIFLNSESIIGITSRITPADSITMFESTDTPLIRRAFGQLASAGFEVNEEVRSSNFNLDLDPENGRYLLVSTSNYRLALPIAAYAVKTNSWVLLVDQDNLDEVANRIEDASQVIAVGNFPRDVLEAIEPSFTEWINNNNIYTDSEEIASRFGEIPSVVITDGSTLEAEFFTTPNPVILSGYNRIIDDTITFLQENNIKNVVIVGNKLSVVGEQIRASSNKEISVFIKFGQSSTQKLGRVYALTMYPMPMPTLKITVNRVIYNPIKKELIAYYNNLGNVGTYTLTTMTVKVDGDEIGSASDEDVIFLGAGEVLPVAYDLDIPIDDIDENTIVEFYTSFGIQPTELDAFLTMTNKFGPPFSLTLELEEIEEDPAVITLDDVAYYLRYKRIGMDLTNNVTTPVYFNAKIRNLIVNGLKKDLYTEGELIGGEGATVYIPIELDDIDLEENRNFDITIAYGSDSSFLFNSIEKKLPFRTEGSAGIVGFVTSIVGEGSIPALIGLIVVVLIIVTIVVVKRRKR
ncbi:MAG: hypothetical protein ABIC95_00670 [archaeon]